MNRDFIFQLIVALAVSVFVTLAVIHFRHDRKERLHDDYQQQIHSTR